MTAKVIYKAPWMKDVNRFCALHDIDNPALYDTKVLFEFKDFPTPSGKRELVLEQRGLYDYDRNVFVIPRGMLANLQNKRPADWQIMQEVGMELI